MNRIPAWGYVVGILMLLFGLLGLAGDVQSLFIKDILNIQNNFMESAQQPQSWEDEFDEDWSAMIDSIAFRKEQFQQLDSLEAQSVEAPDDESLVLQIDSLQEILGGEDGFDEWDREYGGADVDTEALEHIGNMPETFSNMFEMSEYMQTWIYRFGILGIFINLLLMTGGIFLLVIRRFSLHIVIGALSLSILLSIFKMVIILGDEGSGFIAKSQCFGEAWSLFLDIALLVVVLVANKSAYNGGEQPQILKNTPSALPVDEF